MNLRAEGCVRCINTSSGDCGQHGPIQTRAHQDCAIPQCPAPETHATSDHYVVPQVRDWEKEFQELQFKHLKLQEQLIELLLDNEQDGCPCLYVEPCSPACSCAFNTMSGGCRRCCSYGDENRKKRRAEALAKRIDETP